MEEHENAQFDEKSSSSQRSIVASMTTYGKLRFCGCPSQMSPPFKDRSGPDRIGAVRRGWRGGGWGWRGAGAGFIAGAIIGGALAAPTTATTVSNYGYGYGGYGSAVVGYGYGGLWWLLCAGGACYYALRPGLYGGLLRRWFWGYGGGWGYRCDGTGAGNAHCCGRAAKVTSPRLRGSERAKRAGEGELSKHSSSRKNSAKRPLSNSLMMMARNVASRRRVVAFREHPPHHPGRRAAAPDREASDPAVSA